MALRRLGFAGAAFAALAMSSCDGAIAEDDLLPTLAEHVCRRAAGCECGMAENDSVCISNVERRLRSLTASPSEDLLYDERCAAALLDRVTAYGCRTSTEILWAPEFDPAQVCSVCKPFFGRRVAGEACWNFEGSPYDDCAQGLTCREGRCRDFCAPGGLGEPCSTNVCAAGLACHYASEGDATCQRLVGVGEPCEDAVCKDGLYCDAERLTCIARPGVGDTCYGDCAPRLWCDMSPPDSASWVCRSPKPGGEPCTSEMECESRACEDEVCGASLPYVCELGS